MNNKTVISMSCVLSVSIPMLLGLSCRTQDQSEIRKDLGTTIELAPVTQEEMSKAIHTYGRLSSQEEIRLSFKTGGIIDSIFADEGQRVNEGQVLARLDLSEIESQVKMAQSAFEKAERDFTRVENLYKEKAATLEQYQNVQTALQVAQSQLSAAEFNMRFSEIRAPSEGRILKKLMEVNELVGPGIPVFFFASTAKDWIVRVGVSDKDLIRIRMDDPAEVKFDAYPDKTFEGRVKEIAEAADPMTGTFEVELSIDARSQRLVSGFVAKVDIFPSAKKTYFIIPIDALVEADKNTGFVFTPDRESMTARRIPVTIGFLFEDKVAIESGLEHVSEVITVGAMYLTDGAGVLISGKHDTTPVPFLP